MNMNKRELEAFAKEAALNAEMDEHLGYEKSQKSTSSNSRNGNSSKRVETEDGEFELDTPRDREDSFEPKLVKKASIQFHLHGQQNPLALWILIIITLNDLPCTPVPTILAKT